MSSSSSAAVASGIDIERLIGAVFARPAIWDTGHDAHHNRFILDKLWEEVSRELACSKVNVKSKWKYLRDNFRKELGKQSRTEAGEMELERLRSSWPHFVSLLFLKDQFGASVGGGGRRSVQTPARAEYEEDLSGLLEVSYEEEGGETVEGGSTVDSTGDEESGRGKKRPHLEDGEIFAMDRQRIDRMIREKLTRVDSPPRRREDTTEEDSKFFESLLPHVGRIPSHQKLIFRSKVQDLTHQFAYSPPPPPVCALLNGGSLNESPQTTQG